MAKHYHLEMMNGGVVALREWRSTNPQHGLDLSNADLRARDLNGADLSSSNLGGANLGGADLTKANLSGSNLRGASLSGAVLDGAEFSASLLGGTLFASSRLSSIIGLDKAHHDQSSDLATSCLVASRGQIPVEFLRGCGLSDWEIEAAKLYDPSLSSDEIIDVHQRVFDIRSGSPLQFASCFISYTTDDEAFAQRLHDSLQGAGVRCWFAPEDMKTGDDIEETIDRAIQLQKKLLVILSRNSVGSKWVKREVRRAAAEEEKTGERKLFPVRIDEAVMEIDDIGWVSDVKERHIGDFGDSENYDVSFQRLLRDLRASAGADNEAGDG